MVEYAKKKNIRKPRPETIQHTKKENFRKPESKSKKDIVEEQRFVTKQRIKEKEKAPSTEEKKDLDATPKRKSTHPIFGKNRKARHIEIQKRKEDIKKHGTASPEKHPAHKPKPEQKSKGAQAAEPKIAPKKKPLSSEQKKKDKAIMKAEEARRKKAKDKAAKKKSDAKRADIRDKAKTKSKETVKSGKSSAAPGGKTYEDRVKALVAKKASLSKKETADGRSEYQVQMNKLKKENKKAWKKMFKGGKLKG